MQLTKQEAKKQEAKNYLAHFPKKISKELVDYVTNEVFLKSRYIFTHRQGKQQYGYCTHCKKEYATQGLKHNEKTLCPKCHSKCIVKASGRGRGKMIDRGYFVFYEKSVIDPKVIVARGIYAVRDYREDYKNVEAKFYIEVWYIFDMANGPVMFRENTWWSSWVHGKQGYERLKSIHSYYYKFNKSNIGYLGYSLESIKAAVKDTPYSYSGWEHYSHKDTVAFFDLYTKYPCIEYMTKLGFSNLVRGKLEGDKTYSAVNWKGKNLFSVLKINKEELKEIKQQDITVTFMFLKILQISKKNNWKASMEEINEMCSNYHYYFDELKEVAKYTTGKKIISYINKQKSKGIKQFHSQGYILTTWRDYIADCIKLQRDLTEDTVLFPKNLYTAHQNTIRQVKIKEDEKLNIKIKERLKKLNKMRFEYKGLIIRPAENSLELIDEGKALNHCVGSYAERYAKGEIILLFIRKAEELDKSYFTVEIKNNRIMQVRGKNNCNPSEEINEFIKVFTEEKLDNKSKANKKKVAMPA